MTSVGISEVAQSPNLAAAQQERHQDALLHELRQEVMELRAKQGDIAGLQDQFNYLKDKVNSTQSEKNRSD